MTPGVPDTQRATPSSPGSDLPPAVRSSLSAWLRAIGWPLLVLAAGLAWVGSYDRFVADVRYGSSSDSASYVEMADAVQHGGWPAVVPWGPELSGHERVGQPLFPPGFAMAAAWLSPLVGGPRRAECLLSRLAAALLPLVLLTGFRRLVPDPALAAVGLALLGTQGVLYWHYVGYTDLPGLCLAVAALGTCWQAARRAVEGAAAAWAYALCSGLLTGACYWLRNAGLAVILAAMLCWAVEAWRTPSARRVALIWCAGLLPWVVALKLYNIVAFGVWSPYSMPVSTRGWRLNVADWVGAQVMDLQLRVPDAPPLSAALAGLLLVLGVLGAVTAYGVVRPRAASAMATRLLLVYVALGGAMVVASRSRYEWGGDIDIRHALQYTFALLLVSVLALDAIVRSRARILVGVVPWLVAAMLGLVALDTARTERGQPEELKVLAADESVMAPVRSLPTRTWLVSNEAVLFRIELGRAARQSDFGGTDEDFGRHLDALAARVQPREVAFVLVCDRWTHRLAGCAGTDRATARAGCRTLRAVPPKVLLCRPADRPAG